MFQTMDLSASALSAERIRLNLIANNLANANTTRDAHGSRAPYRRLLAVFEPGREGSPLGVRVTDIVESDEAPRLQFDPNHPDAIKAEEFYKLDARGQITSTPRDEYAALSQEAFRRMVDGKLGYVEYPNVDPVREMADAVLASRAYEANVAVLQTTKTLISQSLRIVA
ncbi:flagellar basal body rod protein FlgC [bacterium]|nr:MAG: flagellar basal body rod protein FlgC [bacterium]RIK61126.1 MAG: flagellar basal body rod protein FlgC [Planctomycetota bacterium]